MKSCNSDDKRIKDSYSDLSIFKRAVWPKVGSNVYPRLKGLYFNGLYDKHGRPLPTLKRTNCSLLILHIASLLAKTNTHTTKRKTLALHYLPG